MKHKFEQVIVPPESVQVKVAEWQSRNAPIRLEAGQELLFLQLSRFTAVHEFSGAYPTMPRCDSINVCPVIDLR